MEKIIINKERCIGCGMCVHKNPDYIIFDEMGQADPTDKAVDPKDKPSVLESVESCPTEAITVEEV